MGAKAWSAAAVLLAAMGANQAQAQAAPKALVYGVAGTGGVGLGVGVTLSPRFGLRGEIARARIDYDKTQDRIEYDGRLTLSTGAVLLDWFPMEGRGWRLTGGLEFGRPRADARAVAQGFQVTVNDRPYVLLAGQSITADVRYPRVMPYLGVGWGFGAAAQPGWRFGVDVGAAIGRAKGRLDASAGLRDIPGFNADLAVQNQRFADEVGRYRAFPIVKVAVGYAF